MGNKYSIIIDSNAWNFLEESNIDLQSTLLDEYSFFITIETKREMDDLAERPDKKRLYDFFSESISEMPRPMKFFGFYDDSLPDDEQRFGGFGSGGFASLEESEFIEKNRHLVKSNKRKVYYGNEADLLIASRGYGNTYILTEDVKKKGPLKEAMNTIKVSRNQPLTIQEFADLLRENIIR